MNFRDDTRIEIDKDILIEILQRFGSSQIVSQYLKETGRKERALLENVEDFAYTFFTFFIPEKTYTG